ncbi:MAG TPA: hypothetical protein VFX16_33880 [Pseudonocardiaceae bacterium]|nr:hypothetical protein [Pseudonocardiaceae bacterium]
MTLFIHRDIKPENIIWTGSRVVLIDFNISSRASSNVVTVSSTPNYVPPDGVGVEWTVDIDLYQLGITMLQVVLGIENIEGPSLDDIHTLAKEELSLRLSRVLIKMTSPQRAGRYDSADEIIRALK